MVWMMLAGLSLAIWIYLYVGRDRFWRADQRLERREPLAHWPAVIAVIPARDEADSIAAVIKAHLATAYPGDFQVVLVDDHSSDGTAAIARTAADEGRRALEIVSAPPLGSGWSGKLWALHHGLQKAHQLAPDAKYVLLTDADIVHAPETLTALVAKAEAEGLALASLMARLDARGFWGGLLVPAFIYFFQKLYPFAASNDLWRSTAAAAGGCMLVRRDALAETGGVASIRTALIDDCALAAQLKQDGLRSIWLGIADEEVVSLRDNRSLSSVWNMVARTAFTQLNYSWLTLIGTVCGMVLTYIAAPVTVILFPWHGNANAALLAALAYIIMMLTYWPTMKLYKQSRWKTAALPLAALLYNMMTVSSALRHARGKGGQWKGRQYQ